MSPVDTKRVNGITAAVSLVRRFDLNVLCSQEGLLIVSAFVYHIWGTLQYLTQKQEQISTNSLTKSGTCVSVCVFLLVIHPPPPA